MQKRFGMPRLSEIGRSFFPPHDSGVGYMHAKIKKYWLMFVMNSLSSMHPGNKKINPLFDFFFSPPKKSLGKKIRTWKQSEC